MQLICCSLHCAPVPWANATVAEIANEVLSKFAMKIADSAAFVAVLSHSRAFVRGLDLNSKILVATGIAWQLSLLSRSCFDEMAIGHVIPLLLPLIDDYRPAVQWIGVSGLLHSVCEALAADLHPHRAMLLEVSSICIYCALRCHDEYEVLCLQYVSGFSSGSCFIRCQRALPRHHSPHEVVVRH